MYMGKEPDFGQSGFLAFWNSLSEKKRSELVKNLNEFHALISGLKGRGIIETDKNMTEIFVLKNTKEVTRLKKLAILTNAQGIKFTQKNIH
jgi:hypothetical protein